MKTKSFTLIELLVVIVIIGILAGVIIVSTSSSISKANFAKAQAFSNTVQNELLGDLVSEWTFDSPAVSGKTEDSWGNNDGTLMGANGLPQLQTKENCVYGTCYLFDGTDDYIEVNGSNITTSSLAITGAITLSVWVRFNLNLIEYAIVGRGSGLSTGDKGYFISKHSDNRICFDNYSVAGVVDSLKSLKTITDFSWHHFVAIWDGTTNTNGKKLYIDGNLNNQKTSSILAMGQPNYKFSIGRNSTDSSHYLKGLIDDVRIYNSALSSAQIRQEYIAGLNSLLANNNISKEEYDERLNNLAQK